MLMASPSAVAPSNDLFPSFIFDDTYTTECDPPLDIGDVVPLDADVDFLKWRDEFNVLQAEVGARDAYNDAWFAAADAAVARYRKANPDIDDDAVENYRDRWCAATGKDEAAFLKVKPDADWGARTRNLAEWCAFVANVGKKAQKKAKRETQTKRASAVMGDRFKFITAAGAYYDVVAKQTAKKETVHLLALPYCPDGVGAPKLMMKIEENIFDRLAYSPTQPDVFIDGKGLRCLNTYEASTLQALGKRGDAAPWLLHVRKFFGSNVASRSHFLDWLAYKVQNKADKVLHGVILGSKQGHGKGTLAKPLKAIFGESNCVEPDNNEILKGTLAFLDKKLLVIVNELKAHDNKHVADNLKPVITERTIRVKRLYCDPFEIENPASVLAFTNWHNSLYIEDSDRRWFIFDSTADRQSAAYFTKLHDWLDDDGAAHVLRYLLDRDVSGFNPNAAPPMTTTKERAIESSRGETRQVLAELWADGASPFDRDVVKVSDVLLRLRDSLPKISRPMLMQFLRDHGADECTPNSSTRYTRNGVELKDRLWVLRDVAKWRAASQEALGAELWHGVGG